MEGEQSRILEASESRPARSPWRYCKLFDNHLERLPIDVAGVKARLTPKGSVGSIGWRAHFPLQPGIIAATFYSGLFWNPTDLPHLRTLGQQMFK